MDQSAFGRLPKWAQMEINRLANDLEAANEKIRQMTTFDGSGAIALEGLMRDDDRPLPDRSCIRFTFPNQRYVTLRFMADGRLNLNCGFGTLRIKPEAANSIAIEVDR